MSNFTCTLPSGTVLPPGVTLGELSSYGYVPTKYVCIIFIVLFGISTILHTGQAIYYQSWWLLGTASLCGIMELLGWAGRLWSSICPLADDPYLMQIVCTILAPTPLLAASFVIMERIIMKLGQSYSRLSARWYIAIFCTCDVISLVVQGAGGGIAASSNDSTESALGGHIMLGGICFQMFTITLYVITSTEYFFRYFHDRPYKIQEEKQVRSVMDSRIKLMCGALIFSTTCLWIRAVYRTIELSDGWNGRIIETQVYFNVLDGAMIVLAMFTLNFFHPEILVPKKKRVERNGGESAITLTSIGA